MPVEYANVGAAISAEDLISERPYMAAVSNCMNDVYHILTAYGVHYLPNPENIVNWVPNSWYDHIQAPEFAIENPAGLIDNSEHGRGIGP